MTLPGTSSSRAIVTAQYVVVYGALTLMAVALVCIGYFLWLQPPPVEHIDTSRAVLTFDVVREPEVVQDHFVRVTPGLSVTYVRRIMVHRAVTGYYVDRWECAGASYEQQTVPVAYDHHGKQDLVFTVRLPLVTPAGLCGFKVSMIFTRGPFSPQVVRLPIVWVQVVRMETDPVPVPAPEPVSPP